MGKIKPIDKMCWVRFCSRKVTRSLWSSKHQRLIWVCDYHFKKKLEEDKKDE